MSHPQFIDIRFLSAIRDSLSVITDLSFSIYDGAGILLMLPDGEHKLMAHIGSYGHGREALEKFMRHGIEKATLRKDPLLLRGPQGNLLAKSRIPLQAYVSPHPGWAEQEAVYFWRQLALACQGLWTQEGGQVLRQRIAGVALTTQRATMINLDEQGKPLRPAIV